MILARLRSVGFSGLVVGMLAAAVALMQPAVTGALLNDNGKATITIHVVVPTTAATTPPSTEHNAAHTVTTKKPQKAPVHPQPAPHPHATTASPDIPVQGNSSAPVASLTATDPSQSTSSSGGN